MYSILEYAVNGNKVALDVTTRVAEVMVRGQHLWQWQEL